MHAIGAPLYFNHGPLLVQSFQDENGDQGYDLQTEVTAVSRFAHISCRVDLKIKASTTMGDLLVPLTTAAWKCFVEQFAEEVVQSLRVKDDCQNVLPTLKGYNQKWMMLPPKHEICESLKKAFIPLNRLAHQYWESPDGFDPKLVHADEG